MRHHVIHLTSDGAQRVIGSFATGKEALDRMFNCNFATTSIEAEEFDTQTDAFVWMNEQVDDPCVDNYRFAYVDDVEAKRRYDEVAQDGCCGFFDRTIIVGGRLAVIGCNYGH